MSSSDLCSLLLLLLVGLSLAQSPHTLPGFRGTAHRVSSGDVVILDNKTILIKKFTYDGAGPDVFFWVGQGSRPDRSGRAIPDERGASDRLNGYDGSKDIELALPNDISIQDIDYLAIYCKRFSTNFGHVVIPKNLNVPVYRPGG